jgi:alpha-beta hydrolase superfamily lysophospholipase
MFDRGLRDGALGERRVGMQHIESEFTGADGIRLYRRCWLPESAPTAVVALVHGVGEHSGRYSRMVEPLVDAGFAVCAYDQRGHGRSDGPRVHIDRWTQYRDDLAAHLSEVARDFPDTPVIIYGHSMGSLVVLDYLISGSDGLSGAVISGIAIQPVGVGSRFQVLLARTLTGIVPRLSVDLGIKASSLTSDEVAIEEFERDPLVTGRATVRWATEGLDTIERIRAGLRDVSMPLLVIHGEDDPLNHVDGARALFEAASHEDKTLRIYPKTLHEPHNDLAHAEVARDAVGWVTRVTAAKGPGAAI